MADIKIYLVLNKINHKCYIGQTNQSLEKRKRRHLANYRDCVFHRALKKYGPRNFMWIILVKCKDKKTANILEREFIKKYNSKIPDGYNMTDGGEGIIGYKFGPEDFERRSQTNKGQNNPRWGKKASISTRQKMSESQKNRKRLPLPKSGRLKQGKTLKQLWQNPIYREKMIKAHIGKKQSKETKLKIKIALKNRIPWNKGLTKKTDDRVRKNYERRNLKFT